ncbi:MAG: PAS domain-containing protein [Verrucomicrobiae bacterium]|nr:PAS domain-containing protein [Verrucomicrobiae bacterium]
MAGILAEKTLMAREFPRRLLLVAAGCSVALLVAALWSLNREARLNRELAEKLAQESALVLELHHLNHELSQSAVLAVWRGGAGAVEAYYWRESQAAARLGEVAQRLPWLYRQIPLRRLTQVERQALDLVRQGNLDAAQRLLRTDEYQTQLQSYNLAWHRLREGLAAQHQQIWLRRFEQVNRTSLLLASGMAVLTLFWGLVFRDLRQFVAQASHHEAALRESEELNRTLLASLPQRVFYKDRQLVFRGVNAAFAADLGKTPEQVVGRNDFDFFPRDLAEKYRADDLRVMQERKPVTLEERNVAQGRERIVEVVKAPVIDASGEVIGLVGLFTDITSRKQAEARLQEYTRRLAQNNRELQEFAYVASHDLQEPLRKVRAFGDRLQAKCGAALTPEGKDYLARMQNAAERMQMLIEALLAYSRITTKAKPFAQVKLSEIAREVLGDLEIRIEQTNARIQVGELPEIQADPMQMRQLLQNLLGNALKFHRPGVPPEIQVTAKIFTTAEGAAHGVSPALLADYPPETEFCQIAVQDNGIGFDDKYAERIFGVFQRLHGRGDYEGAGVGLAICRKIAERHGGEITARGQPGQGALFRVTLPVHHAVDIES